MRQRWSDPDEMPCYDYDAMSAPVRQRQEESDARPERRGLYTTIKRDHDYPYTTEEPCKCRGGDWEKTGAMRVTFPQAQADREAG
jgi:hypothetical protein